MRARACPICRDSARATLLVESTFDPNKIDEFAFASRKMPEYMHHRLLLCESCGVVYASPVPDIVALEAAYREAAFDSQAEAAEAARTYIRALRPFIARLSNRMSALDIGTGDGAFLRELLRAGFEDVRGIEPSEAPRNAAHPAVRPRIIQGLFAPDQFPAQSFDLVTCFQTIEHVEDPLGLCSEALRLLRPGGLLCIVAHNRRALSARVLGRRSPIYDIEHLQLFSPDSLRKLLVTAGAVGEIDVRKLWNTYAISYWTKLFPFPPSVKRRLLAGLGALGAGRIRISLPAGNVIAVAVKRF